MNSAGEASFSSMSWGGNGSIDADIDRLRRQLRQLEGQKEETTKPNTDAQTARMRQRQARTRSIGSFGHLSTSSLLGQRRPSSNANTPSISASLGSGSASVGGVFGDSEGSFSEDDSIGAGRLKRHDVNGISQFELVNESFRRVEDNATRLKSLESVDARKSSDDDMKGFSTDESTPSRGRGLPQSKRQESYQDTLSEQSQKPRYHEDDEDDDTGLLQSKRQDSHHDIRTLRMQPQIPRDEDDDEPYSEYHDIRTSSMQPRIPRDEDNYAESSDSDVYKEDIVVANAEPFLDVGELLRASDDEDDPTRDRLNESTGSSNRDRLNENTGSSNRGRLNESTGSSNRRKSPFGKGRRSSYENVKPLAIGPDGKAAIMEPSQRSLFLDEVDDDYEVDRFEAPFEMLCAPSFSQFAMLQIQPEQLLLVGNEYLFADDGPAHLDPFLLNQEMEFADHYTADSRRLIDPASVSSFCFPDGLRVRYIPRAGLVGARRMGWIGPKGDRCHLMVFTNGNGITDHGVAITIQWEMNMKRNEKQSLSKAVYTRRKRRRASRRIQQWWRCQVQNRVLREALDITGFPDHSVADLKAELAPSELKLLEKALKNTSNRQKLHQSTTESQGKSSTGYAARRQLKKKGVSKKLNKILSRGTQKESPIPEFDTSTVEEVTRAAMMRSPSVALLYDDVSRESTISDDFPDSEDGSKSSRGFGLFKSVSGRASSNSTRFSMRSFHSSTKSMVSTQSLSPVARPQRVLTLRPSKRTIERARESYETMKENDRMGSICVVEKCYTLIGCQPDEHVLLLGPLQQLVNSEREEIFAFRLSRNDMSPNKKRPKEKTIDDVDEERRLEWELQSRRHIIIKAMREKLRLTTRQALITYPSSQLEHVHGKLHHFETFIPQIPEFETTKLPLPLPSIGKEWVLAQFLLDIGPDSLVLCLKLMLLERSILVLGDNLQDVTMYACGLIELLKPFEWASAFMPVLPRKMLDFVNCPVPFIAGVAVRNVTEIENDSRILEAMSNGMSLLNLKTNTLQITTERGISKMISLDPYLREKLKMMRARLQYFVQEDPHSPLRNFNTFVRFGLSRRESLTLYSACRVLEKHFSQFCGDLALNDKAWRRYGTIDVDTDDFVFNPEWFINPIRAENAFHEAIVKTQLFSGYVHERREDRIEMDEIMEGEMGCLIAEWVYDKWMAKKRLR